MALGARNLIIVVAASVGGTVLLVSVTLLAFFVHSRCKKNLPRSEEDNERLARRGGHVSTSSLSRAQDKSLSSKSPSSERSKRGKSGRDDQIQQSPRRTLTKRNKQALSASPANSSKSDDASHAGLLQNQRPLDNSHRAGLNQIQWTDVVPPVPKARTRRSLSQGEYPIRAFLGPDRNILHRQRPSRIPVAAPNFSLKRSLSDAQPSCPPKRGLPPLPHESGSQAQASDSPASKRRSIETLNSSTTSRPRSRNWTRIPFEQMKGQSTLHEHIRQDQGGHGAMYCDWEYGYPTKTADGPVFVHSSSTASTPMLRSNPQQQNSFTASVDEVSGRSYCDSLQNTSLQRENSSSLSLSLLHQSLTPAELKRHHADDVFISPTRQTKPLKNNNSLRTTTSKNRTVSRKSSVATNKEMHGPKETNSDDYRHHEGRMTPDWTSEVLSDYFGNYSVEEDGSESQSQHQEPMGGRQYADTTTSSKSGYSSRPYNRNDQQELTAFHHNKATSDRAQFSVVPQAPRDGTDCLPASSSVLAMTPRHYTGHEYSFHISELPTIHSDRSTTPIFTSTNPNRRSNPLDPPELLYPSSANLTSPPSSVPIHDALPRNDINTHVGSPITSTLATEYMARLPGPPTFNIFPSTSQTVRGPRPNFSSRSQTVRYSKRASEYNQASRPRVSSLEGISSISQQLSDGTSTRASTRAATPTAPNPRLPKSTFGLPELASQLRRLDSFCESDKPSYFSLGGGTSTNALITTSPDMLPPTSPSPRPPASPKFATSPYLKPRLPSPSQMALDGTVDTRLRSLDKQIRAHSPLGSPFPPQNLVQDGRHGQRNNRAASPLSPISGNDRHRGSSHLQAYPRWATGEGSNMQYKPGGNSRSGTPNSQQLRSITPTSRATSRAPSPYLNMAPQVPQVLGLGLTGVNINGVLPSRALTPSHIDDSPVLPNPDRVRVWQRNQAQVHHEQQQQRQRSSEERKKKSPGKETRSKINSERSLTPTLTQYPCSIKSPPKTSKRASSNSRPESQSYSHAPQNQRQDQNPSPLPGGEEPEGTWINPILLSASPEPAIDDPAEDTSPPSRGSDKENQLQDQAQTQDPAQQRPISTASTCSKWPQLVSRPTISPHKSNTGLSPSKAGLKSTSTPALSSTGPPTTDKTTTATSASPRIRRAAASTTTTTIMASTSTHPIPISNPNLIIHPNLSTTNLISTSATSDVTALSISLPPPIPASRSIETRASEEFFSAESSWESSSGGGGAGTGTERKGKGGDATSTTAASANAGASTGAITKITATASPAKNSGNKESGGSSSGSSSGGGGGSTGGNGTPPLPPKKSPLRIRLEQKLLARQRSVRGALGGVGQQGQGQQGPGQGQGVDGNGNGSSSGSGGDGGGNGDAEVRNKDGEYVVAPLRISKIGMGIGMGVGTVSVVAGGVSSSGADSSGGSGAEAGTGAGGGMERSRSKKAPRQARMPGGERRGKDRSGETGREQQQQKQQGRETFSSPGSIWAREIF